MVSADGTVPTVLHTCGRNYHSAGAPVTAHQAAAEAPVVSEIDTWAPSWRTAMTILGRTNLAACGMILYLKRAPEDLVPYSLIDVEAAEYYGVLAALVCQHGRNPRPRRVDVQIAPLDVVDLPNQA